jgi:hypothetical protein
MQRVVAPMTFAFFYTVMFGGCAARHMKCGNRRSDRAQQKGRTMPPVQRPNILCMYEITEY